MRLLELYFDDSGSRLPDHVPKHHAQGMDYFAFGGILIDARDVREAWEKHRNFCGRWSIDYPLRSHDIRNQRKKFDWLHKIPVNERKRFLDDLTRLICDLPIAVIACVVDRTGYNNRYKLLYGRERWWLCKTAFAVMIERAAKFADAWNYRLKIHYEESGQQEDRAIESYLKDLKQCGMPFDSGNSDKYAPLKPSDFRRVVLGDAVRVTKKVPLCQIADLVLHPVALAGYLPTHSPYLSLKENEKLIDCALAPEEIAALGIKYSCFYES